MIYRTPSGRKYKINHIGTGRTNPELHGKLLCLQEYLQYGFAMDDHKGKLDLELEKGEKKAESNWAEIWERINV